MFKKSNILFLGVFLSIYFLCQFAFHKVTEHQKYIDEQQTRIIQENVKERFSYFLKQPLSISMIGADIFSSGDLKTRPYGPGLDSTLQKNPELLGLSILDKDGRIVQVNPVGTNPSTMGKVSQNLGLLKESLARGEKFWLSKPFELFQGPKGFAVYVPIFEKGILKGWFATVVSTELFTKQFELSEYDHIYNLAIKDSETGLDYFTAFDKPHTGADFNEMKVKLLDRDVVFVSWKKAGEAIYHFPWWVSFIIAMVLALTARLLASLFGQRKKTEAQLNDINSLLQLSSSEALSKLAQMHEKFNTFELTQNQKENFSDAVTYLKHLIEQIDLLQTMSLSDEKLHQETQAFLPLLMDQIKNLKGIIQQKHLKITYEQENLAKILVSADGWPLQNSVVSSILSHSIVFAKNGSQITIENKSSDGTHCITFRTHEINSEGPDGKATELDRRLQVANKILGIYRGKLFIQNDLAGGMLIRIMLPIRG